ncbi:MAG: thiamine phosphate synthase [Candidatus Zapsychrus exili]|nr:thiamine phosphate synthase [Candidatus Zapsychrus exili]
MLLKRRLLKKSKIYLILDTQVNTYLELIDIVKKSVSAGVDIVQLRDKKGSARDILEFSKKAIKIINRRALFIINDRIDLSLLTFSDGVHLGQDDIPLKKARKMIGKSKIIGISCQTFKAAKEAERNGADYIGFGSVFKTLTKPERDQMSLKLLSRVAKNIKIPVFAIGGINLKNVSCVKACGIDRVAICREICCTKDIKKLIENFRNTL